MTPQQIGKLVAVILAGLSVVLRYVWAWPNLKQRWNAMAETTINHAPFGDILVSTAWVPLAVLGFISTALALIIEVFVVETLDAYPSIGLTIFFLGAIAWPSTIPPSKNDRNRLEPCALATVAFGSVMWATSTKTSMWLPAALTAAYHVIVDMCWYPKSISTLTSSQFAAWSGYLAMLHYAFASFVTAEDMSTDNTFTPDIRLTYSQWERSEASNSCADTTCAVHPVSTNYGTINIGYVVAAFSWISGTNHLVTYIGLFGDIEWVKRQIGIVREEPHHGNLLRSIDWAFSASLMMATNLFLFESPGNITSIAATFAATILIMVVGWTSEVFHADDYNYAKWFIYLSAVFAFVLYWMPQLTILSIVFDANINRKAEGCFRLSPPNSPPIEVLFFIGWLFGSFCLFPIVHCVKLNSNKTKAFKFEIWFAILSFLSKLPLLAVFYGGILGRRNTIESDKLDLPGNLTTFNITDISNTITTPPSSPTDVYMAIGIGTAVSGVSAISMIYAFRRDIWWPPSGPITGGFW